MSKYSPVMTASHDSAYFTPVMTPGMTPMISPGAFSATHDSIVSYADDVKLAPKRTCIRSVFFVVVALSILLVGVAIGAGTSLAIAIPVMASRSSPSSSSTFGSSFVEVGGANANESENILEGFTLLAQTPSCAVGCAPMEWCIDSDDVVCLCEACTTNALGEGGSFRVRVYTRGDAAASEQAPKLPCALVDPSSGGALGDGCAPGGEAGANSADETVAAELFAGLEEERNNSRIQGGSLADFGNYRHMVSFQASTGRLCGGTILSANWIYTAGHCCVNTPVDNCNVRIQFGESHLYGYGGGGGGCYEEPVSPRHRCASALFLHPGYATQNYVNDVCLVRLAKPLPAGGAWRTMATTTYRPPAGTPVTAIGWGRPDANSAAVLDLRQVTLNFVPSEAGKRAWGPWVRSEQVFASASGRGTCSGDSGGPLIVNDNGPKLLAISSFVYAGNCAMPTLPNGFWLATETGGWLENTLKTTDPCNRGLNFCAAPTTNSVGCNLVPTGGTCVPTCAKGYKVVQTSTAAMTCNNGVWSRKFTCEAPCSLPAVANANVASKCTLVNSGGTCAPVCKQFFTPSSTAPIKCANGRWQSLFSCKPVPKCPKPAANSVGCDSVNSGLTCKPACAANYRVVATSSSIKCNNGKWDKTFACEAPCKAPNVANGVTTQCNNIMSAKTCKPACKAMFAPSTSTPITCTNGKFASTWTCAAVPVPVPLPVPVPVPPVSIPVAPVLVVQPALEEVSKL